MAISLVCVEVYNHNPMHNADKWEQSTTLDVYVLTNPTTELLKVRAVTIVKNNKNKK